MVTFKRNLVSFILKKIASFFFLTISAHSFEDADLQELTVPPPSYEEALNVNIYPPTPVAQRSVRFWCMTCFVPLAQHSCWFIWAQFS